ncbi:MAG: hypothetical protein IJ410_00030 [Oscillospiraceae bacterium]|nr:hypothetical protein [Oscillospiraceae bacterium]
MVFMHPAYVAVNVLLSFGACMVLTRKETLASLKFTFMFAAAIALANPLFNTKGETMLFTYFGRNYTLQALVYGLVMAGILVSCINWFSCLGKIITNDKFIYIMGGRLPNLCAMLSMVISLVPFFQTKLAEISRVQSTVINKDKTGGAFRALNVATAYAFEHAVNLSVSMKNRGFGTGAKTQYARYRIRRSDVALMAVIAALSAATAAGCFTAATGAQIIPRIVLPDGGVAEIIGMICYISLLSLPVITTVIEEIQWRYLKSKI